MSELVGTPCRRTYCCLLRRGSARWEGSPSWKMFLMPLSILGNIPTHRLKPVRRLDNETQRDIAIKTSAATALAKPAYRKLCFPVTIPNIRNDTSCFTYRDWLQIEERANRKAVKVDRLAWWSILKRGYVPTNAECLTYRDERTREIQCANCLPKPETGGMR